MMKWNLHTCAAASRWVDCVCKCVRETRTAVVTWDVEERIGSLAGLGLGAGKHEEQVTTPTEYYRLRC